MPESDKLQPSLLQIQRRPAIGADKASGEKASVVELRFSDRTSRNAWSRNANAELNRFLETGLRDTDRALVFRTEGPVFCSGGQLTDYAKASGRDEGDQVNREIRETLRRLRTFPGPTVVCVHADTFGGGIELVSCFDHIISSPFAVFHFWQRRIGLAYGWGGGRRVAVRCGSGRAREFVRDARSLTATQARDLGLVDRIVPPNGHHLESQRYISRLLRSNPIAGAKLKRWHPKREVEFFEELWWADEHRAALKAPSP